MLELLKAIGPLTKIELDDPKVRRAIRLQEAYISERIVTVRGFSFWKIKREPFTRITRQRKRHMNMEKSSDILTTILVQSLRQLCCSLFSLVKNNGERKR
ncbi:hypothetical protein MtrunA17_Chr3g0079961 [Medicago truncatula]|uniref:Uncharacterized protein n=1 Tax=Medicago truncatula TaxID=3880 RepID=A0A396ILC2_MEDTR|nr:hypothetical protein MtrunA17_Chr3g0079961 [Medicago truncatula]